MMCPNGLLCDETKALLGMTGDLTTNWNQVTKDSSQQLGCTIVIWGGVNLQMSSTDDTSGGDPNIYKGVCSDLEGQHDGIVYFGGQAENAASCEEYDSHYSTVTLEQCRDQATSAGSQFYEETQNNRPKGCYVTITNNVHFNTPPDGVGSTDSWEKAMVCHRSETGAPSPTAAPSGAPTGAPTSAPAPVGGCHCLSSFEPATSDYTGTLTASGTTSGSYDQSRMVATSSSSSGEIKISPACNMPKGAYAETSIASEYTDPSINQCSAPATAGEIKGGDSFETTWHEHESNPAVCGAYYYTPLGHESYGLVPSGGSCDCIKRSAYQVDMTDTQRVSSASLSGACCPTSGYRVQCLAKESTPPYACTSCGCVKRIDTDDLTPVQTLLSQNAPAYGVYRDYFDISSVTPFTSEWASNAFSTGVSLYAERGGLALSIGDAVVVAESVGRLVMSAQPDTLSVAWPERLPFQGDVLAVVQVPDTVTDLTHVEFSSIADLVAKGSTKLHHVMTNSDATVPVQHTFSSADVAQHLVAGHEYIVIYAYEQGAAHNLFYTVGEFSVSTARRAGNEMTRRSGNRAAAQGGCRTCTEQMVRFASKNYQATGATCIRTCFGSDRFTTTGILRGEATMPKCTCQYFSSDASVSTAIACDSSSGVLPDGRVAVTEEAISPPVTSYERATATVEGGNGCPKYGTRRFTANRCRLPTTLASREACGRYCGSCHFCTSKYEEDTKVCACRASGTSQMVTDADAATMIGQQEGVSSALTRRYLGELTNEHVRTRLIYSDYTASNADKITHKARRSLAFGGNPTGRSLLATGPTSTCQSDAGFAALSCTGTSVARVVGQNTGYEVDITSCVESQLSDGDAFEIEIQAKAANGDQIGDSSYLRSDNVALRIERSSVNACYEGRPCGNGAGVRTAITRQSRAANQYWQGFLRSGSDTGNTGLTQALSYNSDMQMMMLHVHGKCTSAGSVVSQISTQYYSNTGSHDYNSMDIEVLTACLERPTLEAPTVQAGDTHLVHKSRTDNPLQMQFSCGVVGCKPTPCSITTARDVQKLSASGMVFSGAQCAFSGTATGASCFDDFAVKVTLTDNNNIRVTRKIRFKCIKRDTNVMKRETFTVSSSPAENTLLVPFADGPVDGSVVFDAATMTKRTSTIGAASPVLKCLDEGIVSASVTHDAGIYSVTCKQEFIDTSASRRDGNAGVLYSQVRRARVEVASLLNDGSTQARIPESPESALGERVSQKTGIDVPVSVSCHASEFVLQCRELGDEGWFPCPNTETHDIASSAACAGDASAFYSATVTTSGIPFGTTMQLRVLASSTSGAFVLGDSVEHTTFTEVELIDAAANGANIRLDASTRTQLVTRVQLEVADTSELGIDDLVDSVSVCPAMAATAASVRGCTLSQKTNECATLGSTRVFKRRDQVCCENACGARQWEVALSEKRLRSSYANELVTAWGATTGTPTSLVTTSSVVVAQDASLVVTLDVTENEDTDDAYASLHKRTSILGQTSGVVADSGLVASIAWVSAVAVLFSQVKHPDVYTRTGKVGLQNLDAGASTQSVTAAIIDALKMVTGLDDADVGVKDVTMSGNEVTYTTVLSASGGIARVARVLDADASGTTTISNNGEPMSIFRAALMDTVTEHLSTSVVVASEAASRGTLEHTKADKAVTAFELCDYTLLEKNVGIGSDSRIEMRCAQNDTPHFRMAYRGGLVLKNVALASGIVLEDDSVDHIVMEGVTSSLPLDTLVQVDDTKVSEIAQAVARINVKSIVPPPGDTTSFNVKSITGTDFSSDAAVASSLTAASPSVLASLDTDAASGKTTPTITQDDASAIDVKLPQSMYQGQDTERVSKAYSANGVSVAREMIPTTFKRAGSGDTIVTLFTNKDSVLDASCTEVNVKVVDSSTSMAHHGDTVADSIGATASELSSMVTIDRRCSATSCGCEDRMANSVQLPMDTSVKTIVVNHCPCEYDDCGVAGATNSNGKACMFTLEQTLDADKVCTQAGAQRICNIDDIRYTTTTVGGSTQVTSFPPPT